ncbi:MAG: hypothetical protein H6619_01025 [Deltaproteobacteria bacterium]|nr:hypothetical protein [Deltaproteobacteria bacterium]
MFTSGFKRCSILVLVSISIFSQRGFADSFAVDDPLSNANNISSASSSSTTASSVLINPSFLRLIAKFFGKSSRFVKFFKAIEQYIYEASSLVGFSYKIGEFSISATKLGRREMQGMLEFTEENVAKCSWWRKIFTKNTRLGKDAQGIELIFERSEETAVEENVYQLIEDIGIPTSQIGSSTIVTGYNKLRLQIIKTGGPNGKTIVGFRAYQANGRMQALIAIEANGTKLEEEIYETFRQGNINFTAIADAIEKATSTSTSGTALSAVIIVTVGTGYISYTTEPLPDTVSSSTSGTIDCTQDESTDPFPTFGGSGGSGGTTGNGGQGGSGGTGGTAGNGGQGGSGGTGGTAGNGGQGGSGGTGGTAGNGGQGGSGGTGGTAGNGGQGGSGGIGGTAGNGGIGGEGGQGGTGGAGGEPRKPRPSDDDDDGEDPAPAPKPQKPTGGTTPATPAENPGATGDEAQATFNVF